VWRNTILASTPLDLQRQGVAQHRRVTQARRGKPHCRKVDEYEGIRVPSLRLTPFRYHQRITACADIATSLHDVRFTPKSGHERRYSSAFGVKACVRRVRLSKSAIPRKLSTKFAQAVRCARSSGILAPPPSSPFYQKFLGVRLRLEQQRFNCASRNESKLL
jgi:hypothetical protein